SLSSNDVPPLDVDTAGLPGVWRLRVECCDLSLTTPFCFPGQDGVLTCPCANPPSGPVRGCNNFSGGGSVGATLSGSGTAGLAADPLAFGFSGGVGSSVTVVCQGTTNSVNTRSGAGVRCVGGTLKRLYRGNEASRAISFPNNGVPVSLESF